MPNIEGVFLCFDSDVVVLVVAVMVVVGG